MTNYNRRCASPKAPTFGDWRFATRNHPTDYGLARQERRNQPNQQFWSQVAIIALIALASYLIQLNRVLFWFAFILTRPFGATFSDLLTKPMEKGSLGFGTIGSSMILAILLVGFVVYASRIERRLPQTS